MATTSWPTRRAPASPRRAGARSPASARSTARSESGSAPSSRKRRSRPLTNEAVPSRAPSTTWAEVRRWPSGVMTPALPSSSVRRALLEPLAPARVAVRLLSARDVGDLGAHRLGEGGHGRQRTHHDGEDGDEPVPVQLEVVEPVDLA